MGVKYRFETDKYLAAMIRGTDAALTESMVRFGGIVREMLSQPGTGRVYLRGQRTKGESHLISQKAARLAKKAGVRVSLTRHRGGLRAFVNRQEAAAILRDYREARKAKGKVGRGGTLRSLGFHKASAPGRPPAVDTGNLRRTWQVGFDRARPQAVGSKRVIRAGSNAKYARRLEYGGGSLAARPYVGPSLAKIAPTVRPLVAQRVAEALRAAGYSGWNVAGVSMASKFGMRKA